ncbi:RNA polymerase sigma factor [Bacilliculturomica massiliensis]|uniref:RNA polymerase sigma factor n=1 Tax=Bacilliculturomica massiliensis TaxID=1917867 RepID=UPI0010307F6A|nr:RNA polymerase sigma factor [Bacilliculturomica massiliensis]
MNRRRESNDQFFKNEIWVYYSYIKKLLYTLTLDASIAEDLAQETVIKCWKKAGLIKTYKDVKAGVLQIAKNEFLQFRRRSESEIEDPTDPHQLLWLKGRSNVEDYIRRDGDIHQFLFLCNGVKKEYVQVVLLADYYEFSLKEIAKLLHRNYNTVVSQHARGLEELRKNSLASDSGERRNAQ